MATAKEELEQLIAQQPDDSSYEELVRELAFSVMVRRGLRIRIQGIRYPTRKCDVGSVHGKTKLDSGS